MKKKCRFAPYLVVKISLTHKITFLILEMPKMKFLSTQ